jgi:hypothetical protein
VASIGVQVHGGMGFVEETGAAQHYRDARIAPIYEGTNGIQAADLVGRKLGLDGGEVVAALLAEIKASAADEAPLGALVAGVSDVIDWMNSGDASVDDRLAGSYPLLIMLATATCGMLMQRLWQAAMAGDASDDFIKAKRVTTRYYLDHIVPEAIGLADAAKGGSALLYALSAEELAA